MCASYNQNLKIFDMCKGIFGMIKAIRVRVKVLKI